MVIMRSVVTRNTTNPAQRASWALLPMCKKTGLGVIDADGCEAIGNGSFGFIVVAMVLSSQGDAQSFMQNDVYIISCAWAERRS